MPLKNQKIVVVGGSSGMGLAAAQALAKTGAVVVIAGRSQEKLDKSKSTISGDVQTCSLDFTNESMVRDFFIETGKIDHLVVAAAGIPAWGAFLELDMAALRSAFDTKFWGQFYCTRYAVPHLRPDGSVTLFIGAACRTAIPGTAGLAAVNGAIMQMAYTLAKELAPLRVNAISPGMVDTPAYDWMNLEKKQAMFEQTGKSLPVKRIGRPDEVAEAVVFLVSNGFVTGTVLDIDGGASLS